MKPRAALFLAGGGLLLAALALVAVWKHRDDSAAPAIDAGPAAARARRYGAAQQQLRMAAERRDRLRRQVADLRQAQADLGGKLPPSPAAAGDPEAPVMPFAGFAADFGKLYVTDQIRQLKTRLNLTPTQEERMRELFLKEGDEAAKSSGVPGSEQSMELKLRAALQGILNPAQMAEFDKVQAEEKEREVAARVDGMVTSLTVDLDLQPPQAKALQQILKADPTLAQDDNTVAFGSSTTLEGSVERMEQSHRRLAAQLQPQLRGEQVVRLESHFKESEDRQREMVHYYRIFATELGDSKE
jgi:hypothetical protein